MNAELLRHDVTFPLYVIFAQIYKLACPTSPIHYQHDPVQTILTSVHRAINMLGLTMRVKLKCFRPWVPFVWWRSVGRGKERPEQCP